MKTRRWASLFLLLTLLASLVDRGAVAGPVRAFPPVLTLVAPIGPQPVTGVIDVQVRITGAADLAALEFDLTYDRSLVRVSGVTAGGFLGVTAGCDPDAARCAVALGPLDQADTTSAGAYTYGTGSGASGDGLVAVLHLQPTGRAGTTPLQVANALVVDVAANPTTPATQDATLALTSAEYFVYLPLMLEEAISTDRVMVEGIRALTFAGDARAAGPDAAVLDCPDFNGDGWVNTDDVLAVAGRWRQQSTDLAWDGRFDLDDDGQVSIVDIIGVGKERGRPCQPLPPDPAEVAPDLDLTRATCLADATSFLYTGSDPIQTGVVSGTIACRRGAVLRGRVLTRAGDPLMGVVVGIRQHPEYGQTRSRADGMFDLAVSGGGSLTVNYEKDGYLPAQRTVQVPWQDYAWLPDVVLVLLDGQVTTIDLSDPASIQVARGNSVSDDDGTRQATLLVSQGTQAELVLPGGVTQTLWSLDLRATEYTVGESGPAAMPAELPPQSGYTYALEYSVDEALAAGATEVRFSHPLIHYVENFLGFPVGMAVPNGYYDREQAAWLPSDNGRVIQILSINGGLAEVDIDGSGSPADVQALVELGVTDAERERLGGLYSPGQSLWRVPITHFSPWDCNWPYGPPNDATAGNGGPPTGDKKEKTPCNKDGSIIECQNQILGEVVDLTGTPFSLHYTSDRVPGRTVANILEIPLSGDSVPDSLKRIDLEIEVAGQRVTQSFPAAPSQSYAFAWNGQDGYRRRLQGAQPVRVRIGYAYDAVYQEPAQRDQAFAAFSGVPITGSRARQEVILWQEWRRSIGSWDAATLGLGGWTMSVHHVYDPVGRILYLGSGKRRSADEAERTISTVAGNGIGGYSGDGGPATQAMLSYPSGVAVGPDGSLYITVYTHLNFFSHRVRRVGLDGIITTVAGIGRAGFSGDGGPATEAELSHPADAAVGQDGSLYIADSGNHRVRRVGLDGIIATVAGNGIGGYGGDGGPATEAQLDSPDSIALGPDGSLYIVTGARIRRVGPDGIISTVAGTELYGYSGDGGPASQAELNIPAGIAVGQDGSLYIADSHNRRVRRVGLDGIITTVVGDGMTGYDGDGGLATQAKLNTPEGVAIGLDGSLYVTDRGGGRVRRVGPDGIITTVAGSGMTGYDGDGGLATQAKLNTPEGIAVGPDGSLYVADSYNQRVRRVKAALPGLALSDILFPSEDGDELYVFDSRGRHLRTLDALTGATRYTFNYDDAWRLVTVTDRDDHVTTVERDADGKPMAIVGPYGARTLLTLDANGYLGSVTTPKGETTRCSYADGGLLVRLTDPVNHVYDFRYDGHGRLGRDDDPAGGFQTLVRTDHDTGYEVTHTTALTRSTIYRVENLPAGDQYQVNTFPTGSQAEVIVGIDGSRTTTHTNGTVITLVESSNPRWGVLAPILGSLEVSTPGGLLYSVSTDSQVTLSNPNDLLSLVTETDTVIINGRWYTRALHTLGPSLSQRTFTSPEGRQVTISSNGDGRVVELRLDQAVEPATFVYDAQGRLEHINLADQWLNYGYDAQGRAVTRTVAGGSQTVYGYDEADRLVSTQLPSGRIYRFDYDDNGNRTEVRMPLGGQHRLSYTPLNAASGYSPPGGTSYARIFGLDRQPDRIDLPGGRSVDLTHDSFGRPSGMTYPEASLVWEYADATQRVTHLTRTPTSGPTQSLDLTYDDNLVTSSTWSGVANGQVNYRYDDNFFLVGVRVDSEPETAIARDDDGLLTGYGPFTFTRAGPSGATTQISDGSLTHGFGYDTLGRIDSRAQVVNGQNVYDAQYTYNNLGQLGTVTETVAGATAVYSYVYDLDAQLSQVWRDGALTESYSYDQNGNRNSRRLGTNPLEIASYDDQDRLLQQGSVTYQVDTDGFLVARGSTTFEYSARGELPAAVVGGQTIAYAYDGLHRCVSRMDAIGTYQFFYGNAWDNTRVTAYRDPSGTLTTLFYDDAGLLYALKQGTTFYYVASDQVGTPQVVSDAAGAVVKRLEYDAFGNKVFDSNPAFKLPIGFAGGLEDPATGLVRFGWRDYDPVSGRWTARDPILFDGGQLHLYVYAANDPVNRRDPSGLLSVSASAYAGIGGSLKVSVTWDGISICAGAGLGAGIGVGFDPTSGLEPTGMQTRIQGIGTFGPFGLGGELRLCTDGSADFTPQVQTWPFTWSPESGEIDLSTNPTDALQGKWGWGISGDISGVGCVQF